MLTNADLEAQTTVADASEDAAGSCGEEKVH